MSTLQFGDYLFPHNPARIDIANALDSVSHLMPYYGTATQVLGVSPRLVRVEGSFFGTSAPQALGQYNTLEALFAQKKRALLFIPYQKPFYAIFSRLSMNAGGDGKIISYLAEFLEDSVRVTREDI